jgi:hypothetical protein
LYYFVFFLRVGCARGDSNRIDGDVVGFCGILLFLAVIYCCLHNCGAVLFLTVFSNVYFWFFWTAAFGVRVAAFGVRVDAYGGITCWFVLVYFV